jgi:hypothetical protein
LNVTEQEAPAAIELVHEFAVIGKSPGFVPVKVMLDIAMLDPLVLVTPMVPLGVETPTVTLPKVQDGLENTSAAVGAETPVPLTGICCVPPCTSSV